ncbi:cat eye syndrome chromosome region, candidate 2 [Diaporthe australafricana]|uniref:Cat eye syndrome chromosome region, candidate 2 n=1 Tax=Diaporthe australafricana TaxID=127596 RepID=A0ABR3Y3I7_9PEZI
MEAQINPKVPEWMTEFEYKMLNSDSLDYGDDCTYLEFRLAMEDARNWKKASEDDIIRRLNRLKTDVFPIWHRNQRSFLRERQELMELFLKHHGPEGEWKQQAQDFADLKAKVAAEGDHTLVSIMDSRNQIPAQASGTQLFDYGRAGQIRYQMDLSRNIQDGVGVLADRKSGRVEAINKAKAHPRPAYEVIPAQPAYGQTRHHNANDEDDLTLKVTFLRIVQRLMNHKDAWPFLSSVSETQCPDYYTVIKRPRYLSAIQSNLRTEDSWGYGATAFFNDILLVFHNCRLYHGPDSEFARFVNRLERLMKRLLLELRGPQEGAKLVEQYNAIVELGPETVPDAQWIFRQRLRLPEFSGPDGKSPEFDTKFLLEHDRKYGARHPLPPGTIPVIDESPAEHNPQVNGATRKRARDEGAESAGDGHNGDDRAKRQRSLRDDAPIPSDVNNGASQSSEAGPSSLGGHPAFDSGGRMKRARDPADGDSDDNEVGEGHEAPASKRRRLQAELPSASAPNSSPRVASPGTADPLSFHDGSPAASANEPPPPPPVPSSQPLGFCKKTVTTSKIAKMGKTRPWLFGHSTAEGYGIYAFVECASPGCKHKFSRHPLMSGRAEEHIRKCLHLPGEDQDIVKNYARQVIKDRGRKTDLTIEWAWKSNRNICPPALKIHHPENFQRPSTAA